MALELTIRRDLLRHDAQASAGGRHRGASVGHRDWARERREEGLFAARHLLDARLFALRSEAVEKREGVCWCVREW
jgi:hypothetical protein